MMIVYEALAGDGLPRAESDDDGDSLNSTGCTADTDDSVAATLTGSTAVTAVLRAPTPEAGRLRLADDARLDLPALVAPALGDAAAADERGVALTRPLPREDGGPCTPLPDDGRTARGLLPLRGDAVRLDPEVGRVFLVSPVPLVVPVTLVGLTRDSTSFMNRVRSLYSAIKLSRSAFRSLLYRR